MAYNILLSDGSALITGGLADGTLDTTSSSISLVGKNYPGYGVFLNQNMVRIVENFAKSSAPTAPLPGQLWWDTTSGSKYLKLNTSATKGTASSAWKTIVCTTSGSSQPANPVTGEQWWDTGNQQLKLWSGSTWKVIGPSSTSLTGNSGALPEVISPTGGGSVVVITIYIDNILVAIWSKETTPFNTTIPGFLTVNPGLNLTTAQTASFVGNSTASLGLVVGGTTIPASSFLRNDTAGTITGVSSQLSVQSDLGIRFGVGNDFEGFVGGDNPNDVVLRNITTEGNLVLSVKNSSGVQTRFLRGNAISGMAEAYNSITSSMSGLTFATKAYVDNQLGGGGGTATFSAHIVPSANLTYDLGSASVWWNNIYGTAVHAQYADLAERFSSDAVYSPGTIVGLGGIKEITIVNEELSEDVFGVISTKAAYLMNSAAGSNDTHPPVAVQGRVPVKVVGKIKKGDRLVSAGNGLARAGSKNEVTPWNVIGRALEDKNTNGEGTIEAIVKLNS